MCQFSDFIPSESAGLLLIDCGCVYCTGGGGGTAEVTWGTGS